MSRGTERSWFRSPLGQIDLHLLRRFCCILWWNDVYDGRMVLVFRAATLRCNSARTFMISMFMLPVFAVRSMVPNYTALFRPRLGLPVVAFSTGISILVRLSFLLAFLRIG